MTGMNESELLSLCSDKNIKRSRIIPYWTADIYSFGKYIRAYGYFPKFLPLCVYTDHGPSSQDYPYEHELNSDAPCQFYHSPKSVKEWKKVSSKPCFVLYSPFVYYRRNNNINKSANATGTLAFPAHSTPSIDDISNVELYIKQLLDLPSEFQPVSVCLHMHDIKKDRHKLFLKHNIPIYTAGNTLDDRFVERFYDILKNFSFATSNIVGSYTYYAIEMGIPFFAFGNKQVFINRGDPNVTIGEYDPYKESPSYRTLYDMFNGLHTKITPEQRDLIETDLGLRDGISRIKMSYVLYVSFFKWMISTAGLKYISDGMRRKLQLLLS
jgi:hypothetical protein